MLNNKITMKNNRRRKMVNQERVLKEFFELVQVTCSTRNEREIADILTAKLKNLGFDVFEDNVGEKIGGNTGNLFAYLKGNTPAPVIMLSAHMDCVEPCANIKPQIRDGVIYSDGTTILGSDDKAGVVAILEAIRQVQEQKLPHGDIQVVFTVSEEGGINGSKNMDPKNLKADFGYVFDSSGAPGEIVTSAPGQYKINTIVKGKTAHAGLAPENGINAITLAAKAFADVKQGRIDEETTGNVGIIKGGSATNIVPGEVTVISEARSRNPQKLEALVKTMVDHISSKIAEAGGTCEIQTNKAYDPFVLDENAPVVEIAKKAIASLGMTPVTKATGGGSDGNFYNAFGTPSAVLGVGMSKVHTTEEFIKEADLYKNVEIALALIQTVVKK